MTRAPMPSEIAVVAAALFVVVQLIRVALAAGGAA